MPTPPKLSVIIPTINRDIYLVDTIKQVLGDKFRDLELIVVDQTEDHDATTLKFLETLKDPRFRYFDVRPASGVAAKNFALTRARGDILVFLDDDIILDPDCLSEHYRAYLTHPDISATAGRVKQDGIPVTDVLLHFNKYAISGYRSFNYEHAEYTDTAPGGNMSIKRELAVAIGGFDTNFLRSQHREESEFCDRIIRSGGKMFFEPKAAITHLAAPYGGTRIYVDFADNLDFYKNNLYFVLKYCKPWILPVALLVQLRFYALRKNPRITLRRTGLFAIGLITAISRVIKPIKTTSELVRELP